MLSVRPDLDDVRKARQQIEEEGQKLLRIYEMELAQRRQELDKLRAEEALRTWHRVGDCSISILDGYQAMRLFLAAYWDRGRKQSRDIEIILQDLDRGQADADLTQWNNWLAAARTARRAD